MTKITRTVDTKTGDVQYWIDRGGPQLLGPTYDTREEAEEALRLSKAAAAMGRVGRGEAKRRGDSEHYRALAARRTKPGRQSKVERIERALRTAGLRSIVGGIENNPLGPRGEIVLWIGGVGRPVYSITEAIALARSVERELAAQTD